MQDLTQINYIQSVDELTDLYRAPSAAATDKVAAQITPLYRDWIMASRFCVLATYALGRVDISPRGDVGPVVDVLDTQHLALPDWRGNNRLDSLRNIVLDGSLSMLFFNSGVQDVVRVVGHARITRDKIFVIVMRKMIIIQKRSLLCGCNRFMSIVPNRLFARVCGRAMAL
jgi:predicted pyridoxine 5'-phosphate oxidase superfamily flavin-nucleotide-binding protein